MNFPSLYAIIQPIFDKEVFLMQEIKVTLTKNPKKKPADESKLGFGSIFTDHMFVMNYEPKEAFDVGSNEDFRPVSTSTQR